MEKLCEGPHVKADFQPARFVTRYREFYCRILVATDPSQIFASTSFLSFSTELIRSRHQGPTAICLANGRILEPR